MRRIFAITFGCALMIGVNIASSGTTVRGGQPPTHGATSADGAEFQDASQTPPACVQASQCVEYCAGGIPLCIAKHCACAS
jgi:hypothetical protein